MRAGYVEERKAMRNKCVVRRMTRPSDLRSEDGAAELAGSEAMRPYLEFRMALSQGQDTEPFLEKIKALRLEDRYAWRIMSALKWAFAGYDSDAIKLDTDTMSEAYRSKVIELVAVSRPIQFKFCFLDVLRRPKNKGDEEMIRKGRAILLLRGETERRLGTRQGEEVAMDDTAEQLSPDGSRKSSLVTECQQALQTCPHRQGTVAVLCTQCRGSGYIRDGEEDDPFAYDPCPRCEKEVGVLWPQLCSCMEPFDKRTILEVIGSQKNRHRILAQVAASMGKTAVLTPVEDAVGAPYLARLRRWAAEHQQIVLPNLDAIFWLRLLDQGMIQCYRLANGRIVFAAKGAKEEVSWFIKKGGFGAHMDWEAAGSLLEFAYREHCMWFERTTSPETTCDGGTTTDQLCSCPLDACEDAAGGD